MQRKQRLGLWIILLKDSTRGTGIRPVHLFLSILGCFFSHAGWWVRGSESYDTGRSGCRTSSQHSWAGLADLGPLKLAQLSLPVRSSAVESHNFILFTLSKRLQLKERRLKHILFWTESMLPRLYYTTYSCPFPLHLTSFPKFLELRSLPLYDSHI